MDAQKITGIKQCTVGDDIAEKIPEKEFSEPYADESTEQAGQRLDSADKASDENRPTGIFADEALQPLEIVRNAYMQHAQCAVAVFFCKEIVETVADDVD